MILTLTMAQRLGVESLINRQESKKIRDQRLRFSIFSKVEVPSSERAKYHRAVGNGQVMVMQDAIDAANSTDVEFTSDELAELHGLLDNTDLGTIEMKWASPLYDMVSDARDDKGKKKLGKLVTAASEEE